MKNLILPFFICVTLLSACNKNTDNPANPVNAESKDTALGILLSTREVVGGQLTTFLTFYDTTGAIKWKRTGNDNGGTPYPAYYKGTVYFPVSTYFPATQTAYFRLYALGINNGAEQWKYQNTNITFATPVIVRDTLYVANYPSLYAFTLGGTLIYSKPISNLQPMPPVTDGKYLYLISAPLMTAQYSLHAYDITTRSIVWTTSLGGNPPSGFFIRNDLIYFTTGGLRLVALNRSNGVQQWAKIDQQYGEHVYDDKNIYTFNHQSPDALYAFDLNTGAQVWKYPYPIFKEHLYLYNKKLYVMGFSGNKRFMNCVSTSTGDTLWRKAVDINAGFSTPVVTNRDVVFLKSNLNNNITRVIRFDAETFTPKDSFVVQAAETGHLKVIMRSGNSY